VCDSIARHRRDPLLNSLPDNVRKSIEETRAACRSIGADVKVTSGDQGLGRFTLDGKQAVLIDPILLCGECYPGYNCSNRGTRNVEIYVHNGSWVKALSNSNVTGDIFVSTKPGAYTLRKNGGRRCEFHALSTIRRSFRQGNMMTKLMRSP
jgi:hypothetical protein